MQSAIARKLPEERRSAITFSVYNTVRLTSDESNGARENVEERSNKVLGDAQCTRKNTSNECKDCLEEGEGGVEYPAKDA